MINLLDNTQNRPSKVKAKSCAPFTVWISKINNTQTDNAKDIDVVMTMYNLIEYTDNYSNIIEYCKIKYRIY